MMMNIFGSQQFQDENKSTEMMPIGGYVEKYLHTVPSTEAPPETPEMPEPPLEIPEVDEVPESEIPEVPEVPQIEIPEVPEVPEIPEVENEVEEMSEVEKKKLAQLEKKRATSRAWHAKYVSAGVERKAKKQKTDTEEDKTGVEKPVSFSSLTKAKDWFVKDWIARSDMPQSVERRTRSIEAWMASELRADFLAGRSGIQK